MTEAFLLSHLGLGDNIIIIPAAVYLSTIYDRVWFVVKEKNADNIRFFLKNYDNIELYVIRNESEISTPEGFPKNMTYYISGMYHPVGKYNLSQFPLCFYDDMGLDRVIFYRYFPQIEIHDEHILDIFSFNLPIVFCHDESSYQSANLLVRQDISIEDHVIIINPCKNMYPSNHHFHDIAQKYVYLPSLSYYIPLIKNSDIIIMLDSSFWSMTLHLDTKNGAKKYCYFRHSDIGYFKGFTIVDSSFQYIAV